MQIANAFAKRIVHLGESILDELIETPQAFIGFIGLLFQPRDPGVDGAGAFGLARHQVFEQGSEAFGTQQLAVDGVDHEVVEQRHGNGVSRASGLALLRPTCAGIVGINAAVLGCAGPLRHAGAAMGADGETRQQDGTRIGPHCGHARIMGLELGLHGVEHGIVENARNGDLDHAVFWMLHPRLAVPHAIFPTPDIGRVGEDMVQGSDAETAALAGLVALGVEPGDNLFDAHRWRAGFGITLKIKPKDQVDEFGFDGIDSELFLDLLSALFGRDDCVAQGSRGAIPESLGGVFTHGPSHLLGILLARILVEQANHLPDKLGTRVLADDLGHRDHSHAVLAKFPDGQFHADMIAIEPAEGMHEDNIERPVRVAGAFDHLLEDRTAIVGGEAGLDIFLDNLPALLKAVRARELALRRKADIAFDLPVRADAKIERDPRCSMENRQGFNDLPARRHGFPLLLFTCA